MKIKTSELKGAALDWAVAKCEGIHVSMARGGWFVFDSDAWGEFRNDYNDDKLQSFRPSTNWAQGGPIIEREGINVRWCVREKGGRLSRWWAEISKVIVDPLTKKKTGEKIIALGPTPLIAAMRCYVTCKLGNEVEIPEELK